MQSQLMFLSLLVAATLCRWSEPTVLRVADDEGTNVEGVYRDPVTSLNHAIISQRYTYVYFAVTDNGTLVRNVTFHTDGYAIKASIRGAGDGKRLFVAFSYYVDNGNRLANCTVNFTESSDGGATWTTPVTILVVGGERRLLDLLYIKETGRTFVFFANRRDHSLGMVSRPAGSKVFSPESVLVQHTAGFYARASYSLFLGRPYIHLAYVSVEWELMYMRSSTNGVTWKAPRMLASEVAGISNVISDEAQLYIVYPPKKGTELMIPSHDYGTTFNPVVNFTQLEPQRWSYPGSVAICRNNGSSVLVSMMITANYTAEYALWAPEELKPHYMSQPFASYMITTAGLDCAFNAEKEMRVTPAFVSVWEAGHSYLFFAIDLDPFPEATAQK